MIDQPKIRLIQSILLKSPYLTWDVPSVNELSLESMFERILNYGDWEDVMQLFHIIGIRESAKIFYKQIAPNKRSNYLPKIENYFNLFFKKYA